MRKKWAAIITDKNKRMEMQFNVVVLMLGFVAAFMTVFNALSKEYTLAVVTGVFSLLCAVNHGIVQLCRKSVTGLAVASGLFMLELLALFTYFLISGTPEGFPAIWIAMLPACGMLFFGRKWGTILCAVMFCILAFLFWTPVGRVLLLYDYSATFRIRFPILYLAFFSMSFLLETIRHATQRELDRLRERYKHLSAHDYLTDMLNRQGLEDWKASVKTEAEQTVFMIDIDHFKRVNDSFGHDVGDLVLASVAQETAKHVDTQVCRWGGEEFVVWFPDGRKACDPEAIRKSVEDMAVGVPNCDKVIRVTVSIGVAKGAMELGELIKKADEAMYRAKESGRNRVEYAT